MKPNFAVTVRIADKASRSRWVVGYVIVLAVVSAFCVAAALAPSAVRPKLNVPFKTVASGYSFLRSNSDQTSSAVIWTAGGLTEFLTKYSLPLSVKARFFEEAVLIVGFSDSHNGVFADGFKHQKDAKRPFCYLDLHNDGTEFQRFGPPAGQKYSCWVAISVTKPRAIANVAIREGSGGLCEQYGRRAWEDGTK